MLGTGLGLYNGLAFASLYVHLQRPALFLQDTSQEEEQGEQVEADLPRREFLKILEYLDLDDNGALSQTLADLIISLPFLSASMTLAIVLAKVNGGNLILPIRSLLNLSQLS